MGEDRNDNQFEKELEGRHPSTQHLLQFFEFAHLPDHLRKISYPCGDLAAQMVVDLPDGPELTAGLRKLLEAKDCFVRARLAKRG